jgi:CBS domain-containing protein
MIENNIGSIIVVTLRDTGQNTVGIITERDVVRIVGQLNPSLLHMPIRELMSEPSYHTKVQQYYQRCSADHAAKGY